MPRDQQAIVDKLEAELSRAKHPMTASDLLAALAVKHVDDVFVDECKNGPTHSATHRRLDAWVLKRTWSPITTIGYEIKVSRSDWRSDTKVHEYLPLCHYLNIVAPKGIVYTAELPDGVGLLEPAGVGTGQRLITRRKAVWRDIALPGDLLVYVLMCRTKVTRERHDADPHWRTETLRRWVDGQDDRRKLSYAVSAKIQQAFSDQEDRLTLLQQRVQQLERVRERIIELGFDPEVPYSAWEVTDRLKQLAGVVDPQTIDTLERAERMVRAAREALVGLHKRLP